MATFLYRRASDNMLMLHSPTDQFYEFNDRNIQNIMESARIPRHLGNFVRDHVEKYATIEHMRIINAGDFTETNRLIRDALRAYAFLDSHERINLHKKELNRIRSELRREQAWSIF
jgi:dephospho-CoA kinase